MAMVMVNINEVFTLYEIDHMKELLYLWEEASRAGIVLDELKLPPKLIEWSKVGF